MPRARAGRTPTTPANAVSATLPEARRLAVTKQRLAGRLPKRATRSSIESVVRDLGFVQLDPVSVVAPAHAITFWSRLGSFRQSDLDILLWKERRIFEGWSHAASLLPVSDYAIHYSLMRTYPRSLASGWGSWRAYALRWIPAHAELRRSILRQLKRGPMAASEFEEHARTKWRDSAWSSGSDVTGMLAQMQFLGEVMVVAHRGIQKVWGLAQDFLPSDTDRRELSQADVERMGIERTLRALGTASEREIHLYLLRGRYFSLPDRLDELEREGRIHRIQIEGLDGGRPRYIHHDDLGLLHSLGDGGWEPRTSLLSPFDNLTSTRESAHRLFGFEYVHENYLPAEKRRFGVYVMPILQGDRFIGRIDPRLDRARDRLVINSVHAEADAPRDRDTARDVADVIARLGSFLGAHEVEYSPRVPAFWKAELR